MVEAPLVNTRQESIYPMMDMNEAMELVYSKAREMYLSAAPQAEQAIPTNQVKAINEIEVGADVLA